jgi:redox-sensitive bicupin YhaK (pirin superfamily)
MVRIRKGMERGHFDHGWLDTYHSFSFGDYYDPGQMGFRSLRVINEDRVAPGGGFGMHSHRDMEIVTYVMGGALTHRDSLGSGSVLRAGDLQRMTAGTGIRHSEFNDSATEPVHLYQIWLLPERRGLEPGYEQRGFDDAESRGGFRVVASPDGRDGSLTIRQDATLALAALGAGEETARAIRPGRHAWVQVLTGLVALDGRPLAAGDGAALSDEPGFSIHADRESRVMMFDLG